MISGRSSETTYEQTENLKPGKHLLGDGRAAKHVTALEHEHLAPRPREVGGARQAVVPAADDDRVVPHRILMNDVRRHQELERRNAVEFLVILILSLMPVGSAFHARTLALCESLNYRDWAGYYAVSAYETHHEHEYNAIRNACARDRCLAAVQVPRVGPRRDAARRSRRSPATCRGCRVGQVYYTPWCDEDGKVIDDGTVTRVSEQVFRWTAADPNLRWFTENASGLTSGIEDISEQVAALALQGPTSARLLRQVSTARSTR